MRASSQARSPSSWVISSAYSVTEIRPATEASASARSAGASARASASICSSWAWRSSVCASPSSSTSKPGATPASSGKRLSSAWQKAWMVRMLMPPGASSTRANRRRATTRSLGFGRAVDQLGDLLVERRRRRPCAQRPSWPASRLRISAAAALVKVRQRMRSGLTPIEQQARHAVGQHLGLAGAGIGLDPGRMAGRRRAPLRVGGERQRIESGVERRSFVVPARRRPFGDALEMRVVVEGRDVGRPGQGGVGRAPAWRSAPPSSRPGPAWPGPARRSP